MRVTNSMLIDRVLASIHRNEAELRRLQTMAASGRAIRVPSDDPVGVVTALRTRSAAVHHGRLAAATEASVDWLRASELSLAEAADVLQRAREMALTGANGTLPPESYQALAIEAEQLLNHLLSVANATHDGRYLFAGHRTLTVPFVAVGSPVTAVNYQGDSGLIEREVAPGQRVAINVDGQATFGPAFTALIGLRDALSSGDAAALGSAVVAAVDSALDGVLAARTRLGGLLNRLELNRERLQGLGLLFEEVRSRVEDADLAEVLTRLEAVSLAHRVSLAAGARVIQPTLLDFLA